jgi:hypothetical protein
MDVQTPAAVLGFMVVHAALRSEAAELVAGAEQGRDRARLTRRARLLGRVKAVHHRGEDELLWPTLAQRDPGFRAIGAAFVEEHEALDQRIETLVEVSMSAAHARVLAAATAVQAALEAHLRAEEEQAVPLWLGSFSAAEHDDFRERLQRSTPLSDVATMVSWLLDRAQGPARDMVWNELPGALRGLYRWRWRSAYERTYGCVVARDTRAPQPLAFA